MKPPIDPADIVQETWARAIPAIEAGKVEDVPAYLYGIARNLSAEAMRQQSRWSRWFVRSAQSDDVQIADDAPSAEARAVARDELARLYRAMDALPPRCREIFAMRHLEMLQKSEIAEQLGIHVKQVEKQLRYGLVICDRMMNDDDA